MPKTRVLPALSLTALIGLAACDSVSEPTLPEWSTTWRISTTSQTIRVAETFELPYSTGPNYLGFENVDVTGRLTRDDVCSICDSGDPSLPILVPAFLHAKTISLPTVEEFVSARFSAGQIRVGVVHTFPFDLLKGSDGSAGRILVELIGPNGQPIAADSVDGQDTTFPAGKVLELSIDLAGLTIAPPIFVRMTFESPGSVTPQIISPDADIAYFLTAADLRASHVTIGFDSLTFDTELLEIDIDQNLRTKLSEAAEGARLSIHVQHPYQALSGTMTLQLANARDTFAWHHLVAETTVAFSDSPSISITLDQARLRELLSGEAVYARLFGSMENVELTVTPYDELVVGFTFEANVTINRSAP